MIVLFYIISGLVGLLILLLVLPLPKLLLLKLKYGKSLGIYYYPFFGRLAQLKKDLQVHNDMLYTRKRTYEVNPDIKILASNLSLGGITYSIYDPDLLKKVFLDHSNYEKLPIILFSDLFYDKALFGVSGAEWKQQRRLLGNHFTYDFLKQRIPIVKDVCREIFSENLKENEAVPMIQVCSLIAGDVITRSFFSQDLHGVQLNGQKLVNEVVDIITQLVGLENRLNPYLMMRRILFGVKYKDVPQWALIKKEKVSSKLIERLMGLRNLVEQTIEERKKNNSESVDFLQVYVDEMKNPDSKITIEEVIHQYIVLLFAGVDTTSHLTGNAFWILAKYPEIQNKLRSELNNNYKNFDEIQGSQLSDIPYLNNFINEVLRLYPPIMQIFPRKAKTTHKLGEFTIPQGSILIPQFGPNLHDSRQFKDPFKFDVDRWSDKQDINTYTYTPFSAGPRNCIGQHLSLMEVKLMLSYVVLNYEILMADGPNTDKWSIKFLYCPYRPDFIKLKALK